jgi:hypothetical protein
MHNYRYDKKVQDWIEVKEVKPSRFERKMWQISTCVVIAEIVLVANAIAGGF